MIRKERYIVTGIDQDTAPDKRKQDVAYDAENIRIVNNGRNLSVKPLKESSEFASSFTTTEVILGSIEINNILYVFIHNTSTGNDSISKISSTGTRTDLLTGDFDFDPDYRIEAVANYENEGIIKIYWTDTVNQLRFINVAASPISNKINIVEEVTLSQPTTDLLNGGSIINGNIQYVYNLYNLNGSESVLSPASSILSVSKFMEGGPSGESSGLSTDIDIPVIDTDFGYIRLYSIHWQELNQTPTITLIADEAISGATFSFVDDGNLVVSELSESELFSIGGRPIIVGTLAAKRNRLFVANYSGTNFDVTVDMRAYAHAINNANYRVKNVDGTDASIRTLPTVPTIGHDCVNYDYDVYAYLPSSIIFGLEGPNIIVRFDNSQTYNYGLTTPPDRSMKTNEVYRIGIEFFNAYGQSSPVKWIADVKVPDYYGTKTFARFIVGLDIQLTPSGVGELTNEGAVSYQIVSVERKAWDRTIVSQGFIVPGIRYEDAVATPLSPYTHPYYITKEIKNASSTESANIHKTYENTVDYNPGTSGNVFVKDDTTMFFYSSDTIFDSEIDSVDQIRIMGVMRVDGLPSATKVILYADGRVSNVATLYGFSSNGYQAALGDANFGDCLLAPSNYGYGGIIDTFASHYIRYYLDPLNRPAVDPLITLDSPSITLKEGEIKSIDGTITAANIVDIPFISKNGIGDPNYYSKFCQSIVLRFDSATWHQELGQDWGKFKTTQGISDRDLPIVELIRTVPNQYGGGSYEAKNRNTYLNNGLFLDVDVSSNTHYIGDIYVGPLLVNRTDAEDNKREQYWNLYEYVHVQALENNHNVYTRYDNMWEWKSGLNTTTDYQFYRIADNHKLNSAFNQKPNLFVSFGMPVNFTSVETFANVIQASQEKFPGELIDSWTKFPVNENRALEGIYGKINKLYNFNSEILSFQDKAIAVLSINPRIQTQATDGVNIELGIGAVLYDHKYLTIKSGTTEKFTVVDDSKQLYYYDPIYNTINVLADNKISTLLGVRNILEQNNGVISSTYHRELDEVIFVLDSYSLIYSSIVQKFICKFVDETNFDQYPITYMNKLLAKIDGDGIFERYVSSNYKSSSLTYFFGPGVTFEKVFHNLEYRLFGQNFNQIQVIGNRNDSGAAQTIDVATKFDNHRVHLPRMDGTRERFREHNILVKLLNAGGASADYSLDDMVIMYNIKG